MLVKLPPPAPLEVILLLIVGVVPIAQHTPRAVTASPPSAVILPPQEAVSPTVFKTVDVVIVANEPLVEGFRVVKDN